ncbi:DUF2703 domain-containing protein [Microbacterium elymi]|uniref:DUF2703 domain-containing protein n=1 Tax=Microbacterium elymi TaxID=2909587 RepID=A0ABY5NHU6_9MICO|nr:DUF2703 domain-containing protein [Microbacterium elymi]UUT34686.1 DUF2703 domain-containing protein [Microbacterium elymi]
MTGAHRYELLWWSGCPSHQQAYQMLAEALLAVGEDPSDIVRLQMISPEDAEAEAFVGSPTIRIDGKDIDPPAVVTPALTCRMYFSRDGRPRPLPDPELLAQVLARVLAE